MNHSAVRLPFATEDFGLFKRLRPWRPPGEHRFGENEELLEFLEGVERSRPLDVWTQFHREQLRAKAAQWLVGLGVRQGENERRSRLLGALSESFAGRMVEIAAASNAGADPEELLRRLEEAEALLDERVSNSLHAQFHTFRAKSLLDLSRVDEAIASLERSVEIHPHPSDNAALPHLLRMYQYAGRSADLEALKKRFARRRASD
jgi:tetratricopeptide (TPR) repeat protein